MSDSYDWTSHEERSWDYMSEPKNEKPEAETLLAPAPILPSHVHKWNVLDVWHPTPGLVHPRIKQEYQTFVLIRCDVCQIPQTIELKGTWTMEQILQKGRDNAE